ncbi:MAG TPA: amidohydrolase family protein [Usitatibacter sp.]|jgi:predicted TIM-barrel fold metal-dependent hydrolase|nr:amidohydrolase family protein [Usitatibacter sp.]
MIVPNSSGTSTPRFRVAPLACDAHVHIYDPRFRMAWPSLRATPEASVAEFRMLQKRLGTARAVVVQPAAYGTDNAVTVDAMRQLGPDVARGVAVLHPQVTDRELQELHEAGVRGLRFSQHDPRTAVTTPDMIEPLARRVADLGWHVQLHLKGEQIVEMAALIRRLPTQIVFDHLGRVPQPFGVRHAAYDIVRERLDAARAWVKLSAPYLDTRIGSPRYADVKPVARGYVDAAPERLVWGSDWPHPTERDTKPDDAVLLDLLQEWVPDEPTRRRILVDNPAVLYGF